jgi:hypothetical protein
VPECLAYIGGIVENIGGRRIAIGGVADHIHLLVDEVRAFLKNHGIAGDERYMWE